MHPMDQKFSWMKESLFYFLAPSIALRFSDQLKFIYMIGVSPKLHLRTFCNVVSRL